MLLGLAVLAPAATQSASAQTVHFIVGAAPGGAFDPYARLVGEHMSKTLGQTVIVENKPGANG
ncbi:MAG: tripartite tricarboxylate transporter substrate binding protein, partial [Proteobacteria bacterium]|nr:tripartite tricarboxylate transporter substrate binding protein [Pseudomonadota bacterium]